MSTVAYEIVDVFTDRPFAGNPLAVVFGADGARRRPDADAGPGVQPVRDGVRAAADAPAATYRARIFTPEAELPFAGHPSVGAAVTSVRRGLAAPGRLIQECGAGRCRSRSPGGAATLTGGTPTLGAELDPAPCCRWSAWPPTTWRRARRAGPAAVWSSRSFRYAVRRWRPSWADPAAAARAGRARSACSRGTGRAVGLRPGVRPGLAVPEDPATGSAALGLGVWLVAAGWLPGDGTSPYTRAPGHRDAPPVAAGVHGHGRGRSGDDRRRSPATWSR